MTVAACLAGLAPVRTTYAVGPTVATRTPTDIVVGSDGNLWFAEQDATAIGRMAPNGTGFTEFSVASDFVGILGLARGSDGNVWFTEQSPTASGSVGRITPTGVVTLFGLPGGFPQPSEMTAGPDGNLWFTVFHNVGGGAYDVDRVTPAGVITEFAVPGFGADFITDGPDGALWFASSTSIDRITTSGTVTTFPVGSNRRLGPITTGSDGNLWFQDFNSQTQTSSLDRMTVAGVDTPFPVVGNDSMARITTGPDGNLWYTVYPDKVVSQVPGGGATQIFTPPPTTPSFPYGVVTGPDGRMWFTEADGNLLGAFSPDGTVSEYPLPLVAPTVRYVSPGGGSTAGGTEVTINGAGFAGATGVFFGGVPASSFAGDDHSLSAVAPPHKAGTVDITVRTPVGTSAVNLHDKFIYETPAVVSLLLPPAGPSAGGTTVLIDGTGFLGAVGVNFGPQPSTFTILSDRLIKAKAPPGTGTVDVQVLKEWAGPSALTASDRFEYLL